MGPCDRINFSRSYALYCLAHWCWFCDLGRGFDEGCLSSENTLGHLTR